MACGYWFLKGARRDDWKSLMEQVVGDQRGISKLAEFTGAVSMK